MLVLSFIDPCVEILLKALSMLSRNITTSLNQVEYKIDF